MVGKISEFMCPLCGHLHSIRTYDPEDLPLDILAVQKVGLGQGKGTKVISRYSILGDDDVTPKVISRVLILCRLFLDKKLITLNDLKSSLGLEVTSSTDTISIKEYNRLREDFEAMKVNVEFERKNTKLQSDRANNLLQTVNYQRAKISDYDRLREENETLKVNLELEEQRTSHESAKAGNLQNMVNTLQAKVRTLESQLSSVKSSRSDLQKQLDELEAQETDDEDSLDNIIEEIEQITEYEFDEKKDSMEGFILSVIKRLIEDVEALNAENEA